MELIVVGGIYLMGKYYANGAKKSREFLTEQKEDLPTNRYPFETEKITPNFFPPHVQNKPFFTSEKQQNINIDINNLKHEMFTGQDYQAWQPKKELENEYENIEFGMVNGSQNLTTEEYDSEILRYKQSMMGANWMNNIGPTEKKYIGPGLNIETDQTAKGGFHDTLRILPTHMNSYSKQTYGTRTLPGKSITTNTDFVPEEVSQNRPERFYCNEKRPSMPGRSDYTAPSYQSSYNKLPENREKCHDTVNAPHRGVGQQYKSEGSRLYDSSTCEYSGNPHNQHRGNYNFNESVVPLTERDNCYNQRLNVVTNNKGVLIENNQQSNNTQRGLHAINNSGAFSSNGVYINDYTAQNTHRQNTSTSYQGMPLGSKAGEIHHTTKQVTQRDQNNIMSGPAKNYQNASMHYSELDSEPYYTKESTLTSYVPGPQNINILQDPEDQMELSTIKVDVNLNNVQTHGHLNTGEFKPGDLEVAPKIQPENPRLNLDISKSQLQSNELAIASFS